MNTYATWKGTACSRQGVIDVMVFVFKDKERGKFQITAAHSIVQNAKVTDEIDQLLDFKWELGLVQE